MTIIIFAIYIYASCKAMHYLWWDRHTYIFTDGFYFYMKKFVYAAFLGFIAIPIAGLVYLIKR